MSRLDRLEVGAEGGRVVVAHAEAALVDRRRDLEPGREQLLDAVGVVQTHRLESGDLLKHMLCCAVLCYAMLCYAMLCYAMLCYAMLCYAMLCCAMLCYAMLCYARLRQAVGLRFVEVEAVPPRIRTVDLSEHSIA